MVNQRKKQLLLHILKNTDWISVKKYDIDRASININDRHRSFGYYYINDFCIGHKNYYGYLKLQAFIQSSSDDK